MAAGFSLQPQNIPSFHRMLDQAVAQQAVTGTESSARIIDADLPLKAITLELVEAVDRLMPFGPGNPPLLFAARNCTLQNSTVFGKTGDHLQLIIEDPSGESRKLIWWQGAGSPLPEGRFDLAYTIRSTNFRGQLTVQIEYVDALTLPESIPLRSRRPIQSVQDYRNLLDPDKELGQIQPSSQLLVFAEGEAKAKGVDRFHLVPAQTLVVWTCPPGWNELRQLLETVAPVNILWFGTPCSTDQPVAFRNRLSGLLQYLINQRQGRALISALAAATTQREITVLKGLRWLEARGSISIHPEDTGVYLVTAGSRPDAQSAVQNEKEVSYLLNETSAFRAFCANEQTDLLKLCSH
jgi:single-stranded-DNA-specific exonuclease